MAAACPKCNGEMIPEKFPSPLEYLFGFKSEEQKHFSYDTLLT